MTSFDFPGKSVIVTGGAGFIGSHLVDELVRVGARVTVLDNLSSGNKKNLESSWNEIRFIEGDVRNEDTLEKILEGQDLVFHLAASASVPNSVENPKMDYHTNSTGTFNILNLARRVDVEKIIYASTAAVYGEPVYTPIDEDHPLNPISPYGASKVSAERMVYAFGENYGIPYTIFRIFNVYGPRQRKYVMYDFIKKLKDDPTELEVLGDGNQVRDFCYVEDATKAFLLAVEDDNGVYNLAGDSLIEIGELAELIVSKISPEAEIHYTGESWEGDIKKLIPDNTKIKEKLGFKEETPLELGIEKLVRWFEEVEPIQDD
ncbi:hypothetical protein AKJ47_01355 [candidate division MSBL1 archaeon SCGC-AAA261G05]|uniref:NAD-dependent epimerase/dehydratase domain-containing protein n=1 Tax=candidate division MSBL1 archaeon SCGC-AAA261G05 TaxID=1698276 RepID=A0A133VBV7_9EURY|nr:hypothetical protein AKJ47_01355 [candidate division MSBL1 archaeon SCGC-AAA261G05]